MLSSPIQDKLELEGLSGDALDRAPAIAAPPVLDTSLPLSNYYISTSHNTYLTHHQLYGASSTASYENVLENAGRCVEVDVWDGDNGEPCVYHGWTLTKPIPVRDVVKAIGAGIHSPTDCPIIVSLECHCSPRQQEVLVDIFHAELGDKLVAQAIEDISCQNLKLADVLGKIMIKMEHCDSSDPNDSCDLSAVSRVDSGDSRAWKRTATGTETEEEKKVYEKKKLQKQKVIPRLAGLSVYCQTVKPPHGLWWLEELVEPLHRVVNISESALLKLLPAATPDILCHTNTHLVRVYPHGLRISSSNLDPLVFWRTGAQIVALNWQRYDLGMELNGALFSGTGGWVLKPEHLRSAISEGVPMDDPRRRGKVERSLKLKLFGACGLPDVHDVGPKKVMQAYIKADICSSQGKKRHRTKDFKAKRGDMGRNPVWDEAVEYKWYDESLVFLRIRIIHEDGFMHRDDPVASFAASIDRLENGWKLFPLLGPCGEKLEARLLVHVELR